MQFLRLQQGSVSRLGRRLVIGALVAATLVSGGSVGLTPSPVAAAEQSYTVKAGDTLRAIAANFGVSVADLIQVNGLTNPDLLRIGQVLTIPDAGGTAPAAPAPPAPVAPPESASGETRVTVRAGQTLGQIARDHGVTVGSIVAINDIPNPDSLRIGQVLVIPEGRTPAPTSSRAATPAAAPVRTPAPAARPAGRTRTFAVTMYCLRGHTANGEAVHVGGASADWSVLPVGTMIQVEGLGTYRINDHYDFDLGRLRLDVWEPSCQRAIEWGIRNVDVTVLD